MQDITTIDGLKSHLDNGAWVRVKTGGKEHLGVLAGRRIERTFETQPNPEAPHGAEVVPGTRTRELVLTLNLGEHSGNGWRVHQPLQTVEVRLAEGEIHTAKVNGKPVETYSGEDWALQVEG